MMVNLDDINVATRNPATRFKPKPVDLEEMSLLIDSKKANPSDPERKSGTISTIDLSATYVTSLSRDVGGIPFGSQFWNIDWAAITDEPVIVRTRATGITSITVSSTATLLRRGSLGYQPRTPFGIRLFEIRNRLVASGEILLDLDGIEQEVAERRGTING